MFKLYQIKQVVHDSDLDIEALRRYIAGKQIMGSDKLARISIALNIDVSDLFQNIQ